MKEDETGPWEEFEAWIRTTIGGDFRWKIRPQDTPSNREMVADLIMDAIKRNKGALPDGNVFVQRIGQ
jgi:hypothetical protein